MDDRTDPGLDVVLARLTALEQRNAELEARNAALEATVARLDRAPAAARPTAPSHPVAIDRRRMLRTGLAAGAVAAAATVVGTAAPAAAVGDHLVGGEGAGADSETRITYAESFNTTGSGFSVVDSALFNSVGGAMFEAFSSRGKHRTGFLAGGQPDMLNTGFHADVPDGSSTFKGMHSRAGAGTAFSGEVTSGVGTQLNTTSGIAALLSATSGAGAQISSETGVGILAYSGHCQLYLGNLEARQPPTTDTAFHGAGEIVADTFGDLWYCIAGGTPGTWRKLASNKAAGAFHLLPAPARVYDSRPGTLPAVGTKTKFAANETRTFDLKANGSTVPAGATGALVTLLFVNASTTAGNATIWANGVAKPLANTMVWGGTAGRFTATATTAVDSLARVQVNASQPTDLVLDVVGYYR